MQIEIEGHKAYIHTEKDIDINLESIILIPGAGMDHRIAKMFDLSPDDFSDDKADLRDSAEQLEDN